MTRALIVVGDERRFLEQAEAFARYLRKEARIGHVEVLRAVYLKAETLARRLESRLLEHPEEPFLLVYNGHGSIGKWAHERNERLSYAKLGKIFARRSGPTMLINDCCHSFSLIDGLAEAGVSAEKASLIASAPAEEESRSGMLKRIAAAWRTGQVYRPTEETMESYTIHELFVRAPLLFRAYGALRNAGVRLANIVRPPDARRVPRVRIYVPPDGDGITVSRERVAEERRWGCELDALFFPAK